MNTATKPFSDAAAALNRVVLSQGHGGLERLEILSPLGEAELYLQGAHVTHYRRPGRPPLLFMSGSSQFAAGQPIRGGVPLIFPWFGPREGAAAHGFARASNWRLTDVEVTGEGSTRVRLQLEPGTGSGMPQDVLLSFQVTVGATLHLQLTTFNRSTSQALSFEDCLHTYFEVGAIETVRVRGLKGSVYIDKMDGMKAKTELHEEIPITGETDRVYQDTESATEIVDPSLRRVIRVSKRGSRSTVLWNPWIEKSRRMPDFGDDEYHTMVCVESGNVGKNALSLPPGGSSVLSVELSEHPL